MMTEAWRTTKKVDREYKTRHRHEEHTIWWSDGKKKNLFGYILSEHSLLLITQIGEFVLLRRMVKLQQVEDSW